jgi:hypothetical protein
MIFVVAGLIPNRKSTPVVDEWFGVYFRNGQFDSILTMSEVMQKTHLNSKIANVNRVTERQILNGQRMLTDVVFQAQKVMQQKCEIYRAETEPYIYEETQRLLDLEERHKDAQLSFFDISTVFGERKKSEKEREIDKMFSDFADWEKDTLEIENNPYIRIVAVVTGVI